MAGISTDVRWDHVPGNLPTLVIHCHNGAGNKRCMEALNGI